MVIPKAIRHVLGDAFRFGFVLVNEGGRMHSAAAELEKLGVIKEERRAELGGGTVIKYVPAVVIAKK